MIFAFVKYSTKSLQDQALSARTGAGTVCGGCVPKLAELTNESVWQETRCIEIIERTPRVKSFRFQSTGLDNNELKKPGQHLVVQANIDGVEVQRPYTLTSSVTEKSHYEITVLRQESGLMSNWLFYQLKVGDAVKLLPPSGTFLFDLSDTRPLVCVVGGIGVTPALAMCRSALTTGSARRIHVDYAVASRDQVVCYEEWSAITAQMPSISNFIRETNKEGRIDGAVITGLSNEFPDADWLICGSTPLQTEVQHLLRIAKIPPQRTHIESFLAVGTTVADAAGVAMLSVRQRSVLGYSVLIGVALFVVQALIGIKWPSPAWMQTTGASIFTGLGLVMLFLLQWKLGVVRWQDRKKELANTYRIHIWLGPIIFGGLLLHSSRLGFALSLWLTACFLASLASGALLGLNAGGQKSDRSKQLLLGSHIAMSCIATGFAIAHGIMSVWFS